MAATINASSSSGIVTTADNSAQLELQTGNTTAITVNSSQNVGIGTTNPNVKLDVIGSIEASAAATQDAIILAGRAGGTSSRAVTLTPTTLTASRTVTLPDADINFTTGLGVAQGGTGRTTNTAYAVICGGTTNGGAEQSIASVGTAGQVLTSNGAGALPTFQAAGGGFAAGTAMMFVQTAAPTGWTKSTTHDNKALRVVSGTASSGGSVAFTTAFASQTPTGSVTITSVSGSAGNTTLTTPQIPSHTHTYNGFVNATTNLQPGGIQNNRGSGETAATGGNGAHSHPFSFSAGSGTFSGNAINLAVQYVDVIIATKD